MTNTRTHPFKGHCLQINQVPIPLTRSCSQHEPQQTIKFLEGTPFQILQKTPRSSKNHHPPPPEPGTPLLAGQRRCSSGTALGAPRSSRLACSEPNESGGEARGGNTEKNLRVPLVEGSLDRVCKTCTLVGSGTEMWHFEGSPNEGS